jgi:hypothetical protein
MVRALPIIDGFMGTRLEYLMAGSFHLDAVEITLPYT